MDNSIPTITIDGVDYELPLMHTITLDEERVMYVLADCLVREFIPEHPDWDDEQKLKYRRMQSLAIRDPNFKKSLVVIALMRAEPDLSPEERTQKAGRANAIECDVAMLWEGDDGPPAPTSQQPPEKKTSTKTPSSGTASGRSTRNGSGQEDKTPEPIGITESHTSSPSAPAIESVS